MGHFYERDGTPRYYVKSANGNLRDSTIADARKNHWLPSVTEILNVVAKPQLEVWKINQGILAALTLPRWDDEPEEDYLKRIMADSKQQAKDAAEEGTRIHDQIERSYKGLRVDEYYKPHVESARTKVEELFPGVTDWVAEASFGSPLGYGGKVDLHSPSTGHVVDFKGKDGDFSDGKKLAYDQHWQLSAYQQGLIVPIADCANVFVSRTHPGKAAGHKWNADEMAQGWEVFSAALKLWVAIKKFDPSFEKN